MLYSLRITNGDLTVGVGRAYERATGAQKLFQDLKLRILERIGTDPATPTYGSRLDGGMVNGVEIPSFIGQLATDERINDIKAEIANVLAQYQQDQLEKMRRELVEYGGLHTLTDQEVLHTVDSIEAKQNGTQVIVRVTCTTLAGNTFRITVPTQI